MQWEGIPHPSTAAGRSFSLGMVGCSSQAGRSVLCWKCKARLVSKAGACCAFLSARKRMLVQNPPLKMHPAPFQLRLYPSQGAEEDLIRGFASGTAG